MRLAFTHAVVLVASPLARLALAIPLVALAHPLACHLERSREILGSLVTTVGDSPGHRVRIPVRRGMAVRYVSTALDMKGGAVVEGEQAGLKGLC